MDPQTLGAYLKALRQASGLTLRQVEAGTNRVVKNSYLSQIEQGDIKQPSPDILFELAHVYGVAYADLMARAGYRVPEETPIVEHQVLAGLPLQAIADLDDTDREELVHFVAYLQSRRKRR